MSQPDAWLHTMTYETGETTTHVTLEPCNPWGKPGENYTVTTEPLFASRGYPHVSGIAVGDAVEFKSEGWLKGTIAWIGDLVVYVTDKHGERHKVNRFANTLRKL